MSSLTKRWRSSAPVFLSLLRIFAAWIFLLSGTMKFFGWPAAMPPGAPVVMFNQLWFAALLETVGGVLLLLGLFSRPVAFILSGEMAVAYWQFHAGATPLYPILNNGVGAVLACFIWLYISAAGPGPWSLDGYIERKLL